MSKIQNYWKGWPRTGSYVEDLEWACKVGINYLRKIAKKVPLNRSAVIFDVDETLIFGDPDEVIGVREMELGDHKGQPVFILPPNPPIVRIANEARKLGFKIIILTARPGCSKIATLTNMDMFKMPYDFIIMNSKESDPEFKISARRQLAGKFNIVLTVGDQPCDVLLPGTSAIMKLPCSDSNCTYFYPND